MQRAPDKPSTRIGWGLKGKLVLSMLIVGLVPLAAGLIMAFLQGTREIREVSGASFAGLASETARKLDLVFGDEASATAHLATDRRIIAILEQRRDRMQDQAQIASALRAGAQAWQRGDPALVRSVTEGPLADLLRRFYSGTVSDPGHPIPVVTRSATRALFITDVTGALVASINTDVEYAHADQSWWRGAFNKGVGAPYIEELAFNERLGTYAFSLSLPIMDQIGYQAVGIVHRVYDAKEFFAPSISPIRFGKTGHVMLIDGRGIVLSCPILPTGTRVSDEALIELVTPPQPGWVTADSDGHGGQGTAIIGFSPMPQTSRMTLQSTGHQWHTFVWQSSDELFAPVRHLLSWISVFGIVAIGLLAALGYVAATRIVSPIRQLQHAAQLIGKGELREPIRIETGDELEDLAMDITRMNAQLEAAFAGLTDQVQQKTLEVQYLQKSTDEILDSVATPIMILDAHEHVQYLNRASKDTFHLDPDKLGEARLFDQLNLEAPARVRLRAELGALATHNGVDTPEDRSAPAVEAAAPGLTDPLKPTLGSHQARERRELYIGPSIYRYEWFRMSGRPGEGARIGLVLRDATDESRLQDQLINAEKLASLGVLSAGIGHELNNPLFGVLGLGEAIQEEASLDQAKTYAKDIVRHGRRMAAIIQSLTGLIGAQAKQATIKIDVNQELTQAVKLAQTAAPEGILRIETDFKPVPPITATPDDLRQVFLNVLTNAIQAMKGSGTVSVTSQVQDGRITVSIKDSGPGIPRAYLSRVFDPFFTTKPQGEGSGLGLTIARRIVMKYGGQIQIDSDEGRGAVCVITLPLPSGS